MAKWRAVLAYDGTAYQGFQRQADGVPTVQAAVEAALMKLAGGAVTVVGAGRTDTGVHATGQVIAFEMAWRHEPKALVQALNAMLPDDIAVQEAQPAEPDFHPRFSARSRLYRYRVYAAPVRHPLLNRAWHVRADLDEQAMGQGAEMLIGRRDFASFGQPPQGTSTVRTVFQSEWAREPLYSGSLWTYTIEADAFLQHMVRRIVGILVDIGRGWRTTADLEATTARAELGRDPWTLAPPHGLTLEQVRYDTAGMRRPLEEIEDDPENLHTEAGRY
ncbi:MAG: tRNA pseudouridine(38-40) synthase TruA [Phototrophicales bacterium]|nr:MAG: tRNA pseudouridine(38-40) synthase TruA [Phototrophicales bacterium]